MEALHQTQLNSFLLSKIKSVLIFSALFLSSNFIVSEIFAKEEIRYVKGLGAVLREQPSILSKKLTKLSRGTKVLALEAKGIWHKVEAGEIQGWLLRPKPHHKLSTDADHQSLSLQKFVNPV